MAESRPETLVNSAGDGASRNEDGGEEPSPAISLPGCPSIEFTGDGTSPDASKQEGTFTARVYWVNPRLYQMLYVRPKTTAAASENGQKFLDSFKLSGK